MCEGGGCGAFTNGDNFLNVAAPGGLCTLWGDEWWRPLGTAPTQPFKAPFHLHPKLFRPWKRSPRKAGSFDLTPGRSADKPQRHQLERAQEQLGTAGTGLHSCGLDGPLQQVY